MDLNALMKQAQAMQQKLSEAQNKMNGTVVTGTSGAGLVKLDLKGAGEMVSMVIDPSLMSEDPEVLSDLIVAAHADARKKLDEINANLMKEAAGPLGGMPNIPGMPKLFNFIPPCCGEQRPQRVGEPSHPILRNSMAIGAGPEIERLMALLSKLPGLGPRSARRAALALLKKREQLLIPLTNAMQDAADKVSACHICGALSTQNPCATCADPARDKTMICVVEEDSALWAMERAATSGSSAFSGRYHVLGGLLSALDGIRPEDLRIDTLVERVRAGDIAEIVMALPATVEGQTTAHYIADRLKPFGNALQITYLARGVPVGGELDWLDDGTISHAFRQRR